MVDKGIERWNDPDYKANISKKVSESLLGKEISFETKFQISESMKKNWNNNPKRRKEYSDRMFGDGNPSKFVNRTGKNNSNWKGIIIQKNCEICGTMFEDTPSQMVGR